MFQLLLLYEVIISFHDVQKWFPEVGVIEGLYLSLTGKVSIPKPRVNPLTNHMILSK